MRVAFINKRFSVASQDVIREVRAFVSEGHSE